MFTGYTFISFHCLPLLNFGCIGGGVFIAFFLGLSASKPPSIKPIKNVMMPIYSPLKYFFNRSSPISDIAKSRKFSFKQ